VRVKTDARAFTLVRRAGASQNAIVSGQWFVERDLLQIQAIGHDHFGYRSNRDG
jgi:hypothetical protein